MMPKEVWWKYCILQLEEEEEKEEGKSEKRGRGV
jgi:hypothetical protein